MFCISALAEVGFLGRAEFGPTLQYWGDSSNQSIDEPSDVLHDCETILEIYQSDEGGRFHQNICRYSIALYHADPKLLDDSARIWVSLAELEIFSAESGMITNELRTHISLILSLA